MTPADEMASIRVQIARLKARERALHEKLLGDEALRQGRWTRAELVESEVRLFDHRLLPAVIRNDPAYWRSRPVREFICHDTDAAALPVQAAAPRPAGVRLQ